MPHDTRASFLGLPAPVHAALIRLAAVSGAAVVALTACGGGGSSGAPNGRIRNTDSDTGADAGADADAGFSPDTDAHVLYLGDRGHRRTEFDWIYGCRVERRGPKRRRHRDGLCGRLRAFVDDLRGDRHGVAILRKGTVHVLAGRRRIVSVHRNGQRRGDGHDRHFGDHDGGYLELTARSRSPDSPSGVSTNAPDRVVQSLTSRRGRLPHHRHM
jgi:hypothetical protein